MIIQRLSMYENKEIYLMANVYIYMYTLNVHVYIHLCSTEISYILCNTVDDDDDDIGAVEYRRVI